MNLHVGYYVLSLFGGALVAGAVAVIAWNVRPRLRRPLPGYSHGLRLHLVAGRGLEAAVPDTAAKILLSKIEYLGIASVPVLMFLFALKFSRSGARLGSGGRRPSGSSRP